MIGCDAPVSVARQMMRDKPSTLGRGHHNPRRVANQCPAHEYKWSHRLRLLLQLSLQVLKHGFCRMSEGLVFEMSHGDCVDEIFR